MSDSELAISKRPTPPTAEEQALANRGGKSFCYFSLSNPHSYQLNWICTGTVFNLAYWISPWSSRPTTDSTNRHYAAYWSIDTPRPPIKIMNEGGRASKHILKDGELHVSFEAANGQWYEYLKLYKDESNEVQSRFRVFRGGKEIAQHNCRSAECLAVSNSR